MNPLQQVRNPLRHKKRTQDKGVSEGAGEIQSRMEASKLANIRAQKGRSEPLKYRNLGNLAR
jgi:hypothetical protein